MSRLLPLLFLVPLCAVAAEPTVELTVTPGAYAVGDVVPTLVRYRWPVERQLAAPADPSFDLGDLPLDHCRQRSDETVGGERIVTWELGLVVPRSGAWALPRPGLRLRRDGADFEELLAPETILQIGRAVDEPELEQARPLWDRPTIDLPVEAPRWPWYAAGGGALLVAGVVAWLLLHRRQIAQLTPAEHFARDLAAARRCDQGREAGARLSLALRRYCGGLLHFDGPGATADEVLRRVQGGLPAEAAPGLRRILRDLEALRWSPAELSAASVLPSIEAAAEWVRGEEERLAAARAAEAAA